MISVALLLHAALGIASCDDLPLERAESCYRQLTLEADPVARGAALTRLGDTAGANEVFRRAAQQHPDDPDLLTRWGELYLSVHQDADAADLFRSALEIEPNQLDAILGLARIAIDGFDISAEALIGRALELAPADPRVSVIRAEQALAMEDFASARRRLMSLAEEPSLRDRDRLPAYALLAALEQLQGHSPTPWIEAALDLYQGYGDAYAVPAEFHVMRRRYAEAVALYRKAVEVQPKHWSAHRALGVNLMRLDLLTEARTHLERAYEGDPYDILTVNTLRLLDTLQAFPVFENEQLVLRAPAAELSALTPIVADLVARAHREMAPRYGFRPSQRTVVELYANHDDFAVRTAGLPGIGILGATFGNVIVMDGPSAKSIDDGFDWASALWHELAHVMTLGATDNLVSRWFSEGVSELEEWQHGPSRRSSIPMFMLRAIGEQRLLPIADLDEGFIRPRYPEQVSVSYVQAGLVCEYIAAEFEGALGRMLTAYRGGAQTSDAVTTALGISSAELDERFLAYLDDRFGAIVANLDELEATRAAMATAVAETNWSEAAEAARRATRLAPQHVESGSAWVALARAETELGDPDAAEATLRQYFERGGRDPWALETLAGKLTTGERNSEAMAVHAALATTTPLDPERRASFGDLLLQNGDAAAARSEYLAALSLGPHDLAHAHYRVGTAEHALDNRTEARLALLRALEIAPRFRPALALLMEYAP